MSETGGWLTGCGGGGGDGDENGAKGDGLTTGGSGSLSAYYTEYLDVLCQRAARCAPAGGSVGQAACDRARAEFETTMGPHLQAAVDTGSLIFHEADARVCLDQMKTSPCERRAAGRRDLRAVFTGTLYPSSPCTLPMECAEGLYCDLDTTCPGTCIERLAPGAACTTSAACPAPQTCFEGKCTAPARHEQRCGGAGRRPCEASLFCVRDEERGGRPGLRRPHPRASAVPSPRSAWARVNAATRSSAPSVRARWSVSSMPSRTTAPSYGCVPRVGESAACTYAFPDPCPPGHFCDETNFGGGDVDGRCRPLPVEGEACAVTVLYPNRACSGDLVCVFGKGCQPPRHLDDTCGDDDECASGRCVDGACAASDLCAER